MRPLRFLLAAALLCIAAPALAQDPRGKPIAAPAGYLTGTAIYCDDGSNHAVLCSFAGGSGGGGGDPSSTGTVGSAAAPATVSVIGGYDGGNVRRLGVDGAGRITAVVSALPLAPGAATATAQATNTAAITATQAATGTLATTAQTVTTTLPQLTPSAGLAISFGTTAATLFNANTTRHFIQVQVQGSTGGCYINGTTAATTDANSLYIPAGGYFESATHVGTGAISIVCTAASIPVYSRQG